MKPFLSLLIAALITLSALFAVPALAQEPKGCNGPPELCSQVLELQKDLAAQKALSAQKTAEQQKSDADHAAKMAKLIALAASIAIALKGLVSVAKTWTSWLKTDRQKAVMKIVLLLIGFASFILSNIGLGLPWWQALIVAGGPPGAILVHELMDLIAVLKGKKPLPPDPTDDPAAGPPADPPPAPAA